MADLSDVPEVQQSERAALHFDLVSIFPAFFESILAYGVVSRALKTGIASANTVDLRAFTQDRHRTVDDRPFGGGEGMVLKPEPIFAAVEWLGIAPKPDRDADSETVVLRSAQGQSFTQNTAQELAGMRRIVLICGRYEGVDERVAEHLCDREISIGDYVLSGGELGAAVILDSVVRLLPGVLGNADSAHYESFGADQDTDAAADAAPRAVAAAGGLLDYPHYTRPAEFRCLQVPEVLAGGDHAAIRKWRRERALQKTFRNRPDLLQEVELNDVDRRFLANMRRGLPS